MKKETKQQNSTDTQMGYDTVLATGGKLNWKVNTPQLLKEIQNNEGTTILRIPLQILANILAELSERAIELNDTKLNGIMCRLALYDQSDPYSENYDRGMTEKAISDAGM